MDSIISKITNININKNNDFDDNKITKLVESVSNDSQSSIILNLFTQLQNKFYLVNSYQDIHKVHIDILGSKKIKRERYTISFDKSSYNFTCNCKNFIYKSEIDNIVCKHITFIVCRVLCIYDYKFFETKILDEINIKKLLEIGNNDIWYNNDISIKYINYEFNQNTQRVFNKDETCPICCYSFSDEIVISCPICKNYVHKNCMDIWLKKSKKCVYCRESWSNYIRDISKI